MLAVALASPVVNGQETATTYNNFVTTGENTPEKSVIPAKDIVNITVDQDLPATFNVNLTDGSTRSLSLSATEKSQVLTIYPEVLLAELYSYQYYGLPYHPNNYINSISVYGGKFDGLTDCYQLHWDGASTSSNYYKGGLSSESTPLMSYTKELIWESVNKANELIENLEAIDPTEMPQRDRLIAEAKCIIAMHYFDLFMHYGGLPILNKVDYSNNYRMGGSLDENNTGNKNALGMQNAPLPDDIYKRCSVAETVDYMVALLDWAIPNLPWEASCINTLQTERSLFSTPPTLTEGSFYIESRRWTQAAAMALKAKILIFAASPMFNDTKPYYSAVTDEQKSLVWYGDYDAARWAKALAACNDFFVAYNSKGYYALEQATNKKADDYRAAYRRGYSIVADNKEVLMSSRHSEYYGAQGSYAWLNWGNWSVNRLNYAPTEEYVEMFSWSDGTPFRWEADSLAGKINGANGKLFIEYKPIRGGFAKILSRDPRLYENAICNGVNISLKWRDPNDVVSFGHIYELWRGGLDAAFNVIDADGNVVEGMTTFCPTGYSAMKYMLPQTDYHREPHHWVSLSLSEMYLMYAEALAQNGLLNEAMDYVDVVRSRVGLKGLGECYKSAYGVDLASDKNLLIEEILRERACELGMTNNRFFDMIRYKRTDWMTRQLHGLATKRLFLNPNHEYVERMTPWFGDEKNSGIAEPNRFDYSRFELTSSKRELWGKDKDSDEVCRWLLSPLPQSEIDKDKGLVQNPGW